MNFFKKYTTPFGYIADGNKIDAYGVDHSGFSTRDEVEYQFARQERESQLANNLNQQGIKPENYPKLGTSFWGNNSENNYGFGRSNIHDNIENRNNNSFENTFDSLGQEQSKINQSQHIENMNQFSTALPSRYNMNDLIDKLRQYQENALNMDNSSINKVSILNSDDIKRLNLNANSVLFPQQNSFSSSSRPYQLAQNSLPNSASDVPNQSYVIRENIKFPHDEDLYMPIKSKSIYSPMCRDLNNINAEEPYMQIFNQLGDMVSEFEGGLETNPNKIDQATNMGIKQDTLNNFFAAHPEYKGKYPDKVDDLTREQANTIYCMDFYTQYRIPEIKSKILRESIYDTYVNHSPDEIARWLQEGLNEVTSQHVKVDPEDTVSVMGSETISALNNLTDYEKAKLDEYFLNRREEAWKRENPGYQNKFRGNLNRIQKLRKRHHEAGTY